MKKLFKTGLILLLIGFLFKFLHIHFNGVLLVLGGILLLVHSFTFLISNYKIKLLDSLGFLLFSLISIYLIVRIQYWPFSRIILFITILLTISWLILFIHSKSKFKALHIFLILYFIFSLIVAYTPAYKICYIVNLNTVLNSNHRIYDYYSWDKYSWFLYGIGKQTEAINANMEAAKAADRAIQSFNYPEAKRYAEIIKRHEELIKTKSWNEYHK